MTGTKSEAVLRRLQELIWTRLEQYVWLLQWWEEQAGAVLLTASVMRGTGWSSAVLEQRAGVALWLQDFDEKKARSDGSSGASCRVEAVVVSDTETHTDFPLPTPIYLYTLLLIEIGEKSRIMRLHMIILGGLSGSVGFCVTCWMFKRLVLTIFAWYQWSCPWWFSGFLCRLVPLVVHFG